MIPYHKIPTPLLKEILQLCIDISYYEEAAKVRDELKGREEAENITRNEPSLDFKVVGSAKILINWRLK